MAEADFNLSSVSSSFRAGRRSAAVTHAGIAIAVTLAFLAFHAVRAFPSLADSKGDNDSLLRLVQVRDLLAGQSWFDLTQYRMGLDGGFVMHWSRLVDLPIAGLVLVVGEQAALVIWPLLLLGLSLFLIIRAADLIGGAPAVLPAVVTGALALHFVNVFLPGALDHHNAQLALALGAAYALMVGLRDGAASGSTSPGGAGGVAGICAALMLAIGMEAAPYAAVACGVAAVCYLAGGDAPIRLARGFGLAFAGVAAASFVATVPSQDWLAATCDALSLPQGALAVLGGGGLALATLMPILRRTVWTRLGALAALGVIVAVVAISAFPQCLADPYADLDPVLRQYWLSSVTEAQPLGALVRAGELGTIAGYYATPMIALTILALQAVRGRLTRETAVLFAFLAVAVAVSCWQVRGGVFSVTLAAIVLAAWIGRARTLALARPAAAAQLGMAASWIVSISLLWQLTGVALEPGDARAATETESAAGSDATCYALADHGALAQLPIGTVLTISNLGSTVLHETAHRVLNGPYHRNNEGNRAALDILMAEPGGAEAAARGLGIDYVALCPGNAETQALARWAPDGFLKTLLDGATPDWLAVVEGTQTAPLRIFQVRR